MWDLVAGVLAGDFLTAAVHWAEDCYLPWTDEPGLLGEIARANELHHFVPYGITAGTYLDNVKVSFGLLGAVFAVLLLVAPAWSRAHWVFLATLAVVMGVANLLHRFQHERDCTRPAIVTALQRLGILVSRDQHSRHHREPRGNYGVVLGFTNAVYDGLGVWTGLETLAGACGLRTARKPGVDAYAALGDDWLRANATRECPRKLSARRLARYEARLRASMQAKKM